MSRRKKSKAVPVVTVLMILAAALCVACFFANQFVTAQRNAAREDLARRQQEVIDRNNATLADYAARIAELENQASSTASASWPGHKSEGWDLLDLTNYPLENPTAETRTRAEVMTGGMLLVNEWHSRPDDFDESALVSLGKYYGGNEKVQVRDYNVLMFRNAADALKEALDAAKAEDLTHYIVNEAYRSWDEQNSLFTSRVEKLSSKYSGDALIEAAKKYVNYPGTSEYNTGLSCTLKLYDKNDPEITNSKFSTTTQGIWMAENSWKYGLIIRFPLANWPLENTQDKSFKTGVSSQHNLFRFVGKGNAAVMHYMDFCMEEYIEYLEEHPHIALFEDGVLKYEIYRQIVGDSPSFDVQLTRNAKAWSTSMDNMGAIITVFEY